MPAHPFARFDPLADSVLVDVVGLFYPTLIIFVAVVVGVGIGRCRQRRRSSFVRGLRARLEAHRRRVPARARGDSGVWALPFLAWAWQAAEQVRPIWFGLGHPTRAQVLLVLYENAIALALLVLAQSVAFVLLAGPGVPRLGVRGGQRLAVRCAIATVFLDGFLLAWAFPPSDWS